MQNELHVTGREESSVHFNFPRGSVAIFEQHFDIGHEFFLTVDECGLREVRMRWDMIGSGRKNGVATGLKKLLSMIVAWLAEAKAVTHGVEHGKAKGRRGRTGRRGW